MNDHSNDSACLHWRKLTRDDLAPMPAVRVEVRPIHRPHFAAWCQFRHPHQTSIRKIHWTVRVGDHQGQKRAGLPENREVWVHDQITALDEAQHSHRIREEASSFRQHRLADMKGRVSPKGLCGPRMEGVIAHQQPHNQPRVRDALHCIILAAVSYSDELSPRHLSHCARYPHSSRSGLRKQSDAGFSKHFGVPRLRIASATLPARSALPFLLPKRSHLADARPVRPPCSAVDY